MNEEEIIKVIEKMRVVTASAIAKSKSARRKTERLEHLKNFRTVNPILPPTPSATLATNKSTIIKPFNDIEEW